MFTIAVLNQKGGVGKTTTAANLGAALARRGGRLCLLDLDPQAHLTLHLGVEQSERSEQSEQGEQVEKGSPPASIYDVLGGGVELASACLKVAEGLWLVPSVIDLVGAEVELASTVGREQILRDCLAASPPPGELVLIDCPPSLGLLTLNALAAADEVLIPLQPHFLALQGMGKLLETVSLVQRRVNPALRVGGVILCMYETGTCLAAEVVADLRGFLQAARTTNCPWNRATIFDTVIRRNVKLAECPSHGMTIFQYDPHCRGAEDYAALAEEFARRYSAVAPSLAGPASGQVPGAGEPAPAAEAVPATPGADMAAVSVPEADSPSSIADVAPGRAASDEPASATAPSEMIPACRPTALGGIEQAPFGSGPQGRRPQP